MSVLEFIYEFKAICSDYNSLSGDFPNENLRCFTKQYLYEHHAGESGSV